MRLKFRERIQHSRSEKALFGRANAYIAAARQACPVNWNRPMLVGGQEALVGQPAAFVPD